MSSVFHGYVFFFVNRCLYVFFYLFFHLMCHLHIVFDCFIFV